MFLRNDTCFSSRENSDVYISISIATHFSGDQFKFKNGITWDIFPTSTFIFQANVSSDEYQRMMSVYKQSVRQTEALRNLRDHFDAHLDQTEKFDDIVLYSG